VEHRVRVLDQELNKVRVPYVASDKDQVLLVKAVRQIAQTAGAQVVDDDYLVFPRQQSLNQMGADKTGTPSHQCIHGRPDLPCVSYTSIIVGLDSVPVGCAQNGKAPRVAVPARCNAA